MFAGLCAFLAGVASQAGDADSSRAPGLTSGSWTEPGVLACTLQFTVILKNPANCLWRWEPDRRYNFFVRLYIYVPSHVWLKYRCMWRKHNFCFWPLTNPTNIGLSVLVGKEHSVSRFNLTYRYTDVLSKNNQKFDIYWGQMYPAELEIKDTRKSKTSAFT